MKKKITALILGAIALPFVILAMMMLVASPFYGRDIEWMTLEAMGGTAGFTVGILCLLALPIKLKYRVIIALLYWPLMSGLMMYWGMFFACLAFDRCL